MTKEACSVRVAGGTGSREVCRIQWIAHAHTRSTQGCSQAWSRSQVTWAGTMTGQLTVPCRAETWEEKCFGKLGGSTLSSPADEIGQRFPVLGERAQPGRPE